MLSPTPLSLICALLLCLPLAVVFTITTPTFKTTVPLKPQGLQDSISASKRRQKLFLNPIITSPPPPPPPPFPTTDKSLFRAAARVNSRPFPRTAPKKIAFMFLTTAPLPFAPLWELFFAKAPTSHYNIYIHADPTQVYDTPFSGVFLNRTIRSEPTQRLSPSLSAAARRLLAHALVHDPKNSIFVLLSPSCIPLRSFNFTYETLAESKKSFIEVLENETGSYDRWAARGADVMLPEVTLDDFRIGSQFWALTRKHARLVARDKKMWPKFDLPCVSLDSCYPEENYFPTLVNKHDPRGCVRTTLTHVDWTGREDGHPRTYEAYEVGPELVLSLRAARPRYGDECANPLPLSASIESGVPGPGFDSGRRNMRHDPFLFARKFAPETLEALMSIAGDVILAD